MNIFFLAAGLGSRFKPLTDKYPKPCVPFLNVPMGLYAFRFFENLNISACVANSYHLPAQIENLYATQPYYKNTYKNKIAISNESHSDGQIRSQILGSAGGLKRASKYFSEDETILMLNGDEIFFTPRLQFLHEAYKQHVTNKNLATLIVTTHPEAGNKFGAIWTDGPKVKNIGKANAHPGLRPQHYIGLVFLNKKVLSLIPENKETNILYDILIPELDSQSVEVYNLDCTWYEAGNALDYLAATQSALRSLDNKTLDFINKYDPSKLVKNFGGVSLISDHISIDEKKLYGFNVISKSTNPANLTSVEKIENSVLFDNEILSLKTF